MIYHVIHAQDMPCQVYTLRVPGISACCRAVLCSVYGRPFIDHDISPDGKYVPVLVQAVGGRRSDMPGVCSDLFLLSCSLFGEVREVLDHFFCFCDMRDMMMRKTHTRYK